MIKPRVVEVSAVNKMRGPPSGSPSAGRGCRLVLGTRVPAPPGASPRYALGPARTLRYASQRVEFLEKIS